MMEFIEASMQDTTIVKIYFITDKPQVTGN